MNTIRFESILNPEKYGYVFEPSSTEHWDACYRTSNLLSYHSFYFETYGDRQTQHTPLCPVSSNEMALDWMLSLAKHLSEQPDCYGYELNSLFGYAMPNHECAQFLAGIKAPKETDPMIYYSVAEMKVSKSESKRHDKRWFALPSSAFQLYYDIDRFVSLWQNGQDPRQLTTIERLGLYFAIADGLNRSVSYSASDAIQKFTNEETLQTARVLRQMILALASIQNAKYNVECVIGNHLRSKQTATKAAA